jgi:hypothetical protein
MGRKTSKAPPCGVGEASSVLDPAGSRVLASSSMGSYRFGRPRGTTNRTPPSSSRHGRVSRGNARVRQPEAAVAKRMKFRTRAVRTAVLRGSGRSEDQIALVRLRYAP